MQRETSRQSRILVVGGPTSKPRVTSLRSTIRKIVGRARNRCIEQDGQLAPTAKNADEIEKAAIRQVNSGNTPDRGISHPVGLGCLRPSTPFHNDHHRHEPAISPLISGSVTPDVVAVEPKRASIASVLGSDIIPRVFVDEWHAESVAARDIPARAASSSWAEQYRKRVSRLCEAPSGRSLVLRDRCFEREGVAPTAKNTDEIDRAAIRQVNSGNTPDRGISHPAGSGVLCAPGRPYRDDSDRIVFG